MSEQFTETLQADELQKLIDREIHGGTHNLVEVASFTGLSFERINELVDSGELNRVWIFDEWYIPKAELERFMGEKIPSRMVGATVWLEI